MAEKEFIEREAVNTICLKHYNESFDYIPAHEALYAVTDDINQIPAADVVEVVHGEWIKGKKEKLYYNDDMSGYYDFPVTCSVCKFDITDEGFYETDYCPKCGAKMGGERRKIND